jgi:hypothetical protein
LQRSRNLEPLDPVITTQASKRWPQTPQKKQKLRRAEVRGQVKRRTSGDRNRERPTSASIRTASEWAMKQFSGFDPDKDRDEQITQYVSIESDRCKTAVTGGLREFIKGNDYTFMADILRTLPVRKRRKVIQNIVLSFTEDALAVFNKPEVQEELTDSAMKMTKADAVMLFYMGNNSKQQWDQMAAAVNKLAQGDLRKQYGGVIPCYKTLNRYLEKTGAKLCNDDLTVIDQDQDLDEAIDVTLVDEEGEEVLEPADEKQQKQRAAFVKDVIRRLVVPELLGIRKYLPKCFASMKEAGKIDIVLAIDNTARANFGGVSLKLEQVVIKIMLPGIDSAQQSPALAIPILFMEGDETYASLKKVQTEQMGMSLKRLVDVPLGSGEKTCTLCVNWHLCSDHKLVALFGGFGVSYWNKPCFICDWDRTNPFTDVTIRFEDDILKRTEWAEKFFKPIHEAQAELKAATKKANATKNCSVAANAAKQNQVDQAKKKRDTAFKEVGDMLKSCPEHELVKLLNNCQCLQPRAAGLAKKHLKPAKDAFFK